MSGFFQAPRDRSEDGSEGSTNRSHHAENTHDPWPMASRYMFSNPPSRSSSYSGSDSRPPSFFAEFGHPMPGMTPEIRLAMMANFIHGKQEEKLWTTGAKGEGVFLKRNRGSYITCPETLSHDGSLTFTAIYHLNVQVCWSCMTC